MRRRTVLALPLVLASCGQAGNTGDPRNARGGNKGDYSYPASDYAAQGKGRPGGTLRATVAADTNTLDVHAISHTNVQFLGRLLFDGLVYLDAEGGITPWLAERWEISSDRLTYRFHLRRGVTFSDGSPFDAEAVRVNLEHMRAPETKSALAAAYIAPYAEGRVIDPHTFEARLKEPYAPFLNVLAQSWLSMISPKQIREAPETIAAHPIGSGPFVLERYRRQQDLHLVRRVDYDWAPAFIRHTGPAYVERVEIDIVPEALTRFTGLVTGDHQLTFDAPVQNARAIRSQPSLAFDSRIRTGLPYRAINFNTERAPFTDVRVRRALAHAVDRDAITRSVFFGENLPAYGFLARTTRFYDPSLEGELRYDPGKAARLLDEAGWTGRDPDGVRTGNGRRLAAEILTQDTPTLAALNVAVQSDFRKVGFDLEIVQLPLAQLTERRRAGTYQATAAGVWHTNTPDGLFIVYHSSEIISARRIGQNSARLRDAALDDALARARRSHDAAEQKALYTAAQRRLIELVPGIPLDENHSQVAYSRKLKGLVFDTSHNTPVLTTAWIEGRAS